jgi:hypothetical protein
LFLPCEAHSPGEPEQPRINDNRARFLQDLSAESLLPGLGAIFPPSANLLIPQGSWRSINSDDGARRDSLSLR